MHRKFLDREAGAAGGLRRDVGRVDLGELSVHKGGQAASFIAHAGREMVWSVLL